MGYFSAGLFMSFQYVEHLLGASDEAVEGHRQFSIEDDVFLHHDSCPHFVWVPPPCRGVPRGCGDVLRIRYSNPRRPAT